MSKSRHKSSFLTKDHDPGDKKMALRTRSMPFKAILFTRLD